MAYQISTRYMTGQALYCLIFDYTNGKVWYPSSSVFETYGTGSRNASNYAISLTEIAVGYYVGEWPSAMAVGT